MQLGLITARLNSINTKGYYTKKSEISIRHEKIKIRLNCLCFRIRSMHFDRKGQRIQKNACKNFGLDGLYMRTFSTAGCWLNRSNSVAYTANAEINVMLKKEKNHSESIYLQMEKSRHCSKPSQKWLIFKNPLRAQ